MALAAHTRLGSFEVLNPIGSGGMGEVYRARDTRLDRTVALKILPPGSVDHPGARERFEREAKAISSLKHPNICVLHDVGKDNGIDFLVLELLEGQSLQQVLSKGPLPVRDAIRLGIEITAALDAAHSAGVMHRDLKPANVIVTKSGAKLIDFGLAKTITPAVAGADGATLTSDQTKEGSIVGTLQYMAPEQLEGKPAGARSDVFAFGCVLYEMLTGSPAFSGNTAASVIAAIMSGEPKALVATERPIPLTLQRIVRSCLAKDPDERFQTARDVKRALEWAADEAPIRHSRASVLPWLLAAGCALGIVFATGVLMKRRATAPPPPAAVRFRLSEPEGAWLQRFITTKSLAIAPSGGGVAMIANDAHGPRIWIRSLDSLTAVPLGGTEGAITLFWSPDSKYIAFYAGTKLKKVPADGGGAPVTICDLPNVWMGTWTSNDEILVSTDPGASAARIRADTGAVVQRKAAPWPAFLPGGKEILYLSMNPEGYRVQLEDLSTGRVTPLMQTDTQAVFAPAMDGSRRGYVLFGRGSTLLAQPLDPGNPKVEGEAIPIAEHVPFFQPTAWSEFDVSVDGNLVFGTGESQADLVWMDRSGNESRIPGESKDYWNAPRIDPKSPKMATDVYDLATGGLDIWTVDQRTSAAERITSDPGAEALPVWSPDGRQMAFGSAQREGPQLRVLQVGQHDSPATYPPGNFQGPSDWSPDGRWIAFNTAGELRRGEIWFASARPDRKVYPVVQDQPFDCSFGAFSSDGKYLAYSSDQGGRHEIYVQAIDSGVPPHVIGEKMRVSVSGGSAPRWRRDGRELFFLSPDQEMMSASVMPGSPPRFGTPVRLYTLPASINSMDPSGVFFDVDADGSRFLVINRRRPQADHLQMILNWQALLKR